jgi:hypothetical protein
MLHSIAAISLAACGSVGPSDEALDSDETIERNIPSPATLQRELSSDSNKLFGTDMEAREEMDAHFARLDNRKLELDAVLQHAFPARIADSTLEVRLLASGKTVLIAAGPRRFDGVDVFLLDVPAGVSVLAAAGPSLQSGSGGRVTLDTSMSRFRSDLRTEQEPRHHSAFLDCFPDSILYGTSGSSPQPDSPRIELDSVVAKYGGEARKLLRQSISSCLKGNSASVEMDLVAERMRPERGVLVYFGPDRTILLLAANGNPSSSDGINLVIRGESTWRVIGYAGNAGPGGAEGRVLGTAFFKRDGRSD